MAAPTFRIEDLALHAGFRHLSSIAGITLDLRYGTPNNFVGRDLYGDLDCAWLHKEAADALEAASSVLSSTHPHLRLLVLDALRPQRVQEALWQALEGTPLTMYLAHPAAGSIHSFGMAVDVTLADAGAGELDMGTPFDDLTELSHPALEEGYFLQGQLTEHHLANRQLLRRVMTGSGYRGISTEWWHFDFGDRQQVRANYPRVL
ncbi:MAG: M15 family metallopeptidase [Burkholderiales bacterium]|nr:M15 family metallopeptidase [Rhodocyclaceae bacterium]